MDYDDLNISRVFLSTKAGRREAKKAGRDLATPHYTHKNRSLRAQLTLTQVDIQVPLWHSATGVAVRYFTWVLAATSENTGLLQVLFLYLSAPPDCD